MTGQTVASEADASETGIDVLLNGVVGSFMVEYAASLVEATVVKDLGAILEPFCGESRTGLPYIFRPAIGHNYIGHGCVGHNYVGCATSSGRRMDQ